jgi:hypothetical protein
MCVAAMAHSARLRADDRRPARGSLEPRDVDLDVDEACRAHRPGHHARSVVGVPRDRTGPHEFPAGPQESQHLRVREDDLLITQGNLAITYKKLGRLEEALRTERDVYSGRLKLQGEDHPQTLIAASNYTASFIRLRRFEDAKALLRKKIPVA